VLIRGHERAITMLGPDVSGLTVGSERGAPGALIPVPNGCAASLSSRTVFCRIKNCYFRYLIIQVLSCFCYHHAKLASSYYPEPFFHNCLTDKLDKNQCLAYFMVS